MWTMLAGVPGKLKTLLDRLTSTRAANLDNLNATISSRAESATALNNTVWTDARAGKLDSAILTTGVIRSIQTGYVEAVTAAGSGEDVRYLDVSISSVTASKCVVLFSGGAGASADDAIVKISTTISRVSEVTARIVSSTTLRLSQPRNGAGTIYITGRYQVVEFY